MTKTPDHPDADHPADPEVAMSDGERIFLTQRAELSLLRRAIERLTDERAEQPDYTPSFEGVDQRLAAIDQWARAIAERPGIKLTPETMAQEIKQSAATARDEDRQMLNKAAISMSRQAEAIEAIIGTARTRDQQAVGLIRCSLLSAFLGMLLWATLPGMIARALPARWAVPERLAAMSLRTDIWDGGARMMNAADPERWKQIVELVKREDDRLKAEKDAAERESAEKEKQKKAKAKAKRKRK